MNTINQEEDFYYKKQIIKSNKNTRANMNNPLINQKQKKPINNILVKKNMKLFIPAKLSNIQKLREYVKPPKNISNKSNEEKTFDTMQNNNNYDDLINYNTINELNEDILFERPKVKIKIYSTKHNNKNRNTISSEKNNNPIKYKIHRIKPKNLKCSEKTIFSPSQSNTIINLNNINYNLLNSIQNSFDSSETNVSRKKKDYSSINYYYNLMQEKNLNTLNNKIEHLISNSFINTETSNNNIFDTNNNENLNININENIYNKNIFFNNNKPNYNKKIIYKKKLERRKSKYSGTFSDLTFLEKESNKGDINKYNYNNRNKINKNITINTLPNNKRYELISYDYQTPNKSEFSNKTVEFDKINYYNKNSYIVLPTFTSLSRENKNNKDYIKIENNNKNDLILNDIKAETINFIETDKNEKFYRKKNNTVFRNKKSFDYKSTKNSSSNILNKKIKYNYNKRNNNNKGNDKNNINYYIKNNLNININENNKNISNNNINKEEAKNSNINIDEPKMVRINDIDNETNNIKYEEQKNENDISPEIGGVYFNNTINFDRNVFGKKPDPNFGFSHDPYVQSSENPEKLKEIEKMKRLQFTMSKTSNGGFFDKNRSNGMAHYQMNPNLSNFNQYQKSNKNFNKMNYVGNIANNLGSVGQLNLNGNINGGENTSNEINKMNRTSIGFRPIKQTYEEKLDNFMAIHNLKYIEPQKNDIKPSSPSTPPENGYKQPINSNKEKKSNLSNASGNNLNKKVNNKK